MRIDKALGKTVNDIADSFVGSGNDSTSDEIKIAIKVDTTQIYRAIEKANELKTLLEEVSSLLRSLGAVTNNYVTTNNYRDNQ